MSTGETMSQLPLHNIRVLDLAHLLPGEFATMWLAALGADVIKVESAQGESFAHEGLLIHELVNRGKRSIALDLKTESGQRALHMLAATADVLVEGFRPGVTARLNADYQTLRAINPRLIYCSITGFGQDGPYQNRPAHDLNYVAFTGILEKNLRHGDAASAVPHPLPIQLADVGGGAMPAVINILAALHARQKTGEGQYLDVSMLDGTLAFAFLLLNTPSTILMGGAMSYNVYETKDGRTLSVSALEAKFWRHICEKIERPDLIPLGNDTKANVNELRELFRTRTLKEWLRLFDSDQTCIAPVLTPDEVEHDPQIIHRGVLKRDGEKLFVAMPSRFNDQPAHLASPAPKRGEHTEEVLKEIS